MRNNIRHCAFLIPIFFWSTPTLATPSLSAQNVATDSTNHSTVEPEIPDSTYHLHMSMIPSHAWGDVKTSFWGKNGIILVGGVGLSLAFLTVDDEVNEHFSNSPVFSQNFDDTEGLIFSPYIVGGASFAAYLVSTQLSDARFSLATESMVESWLGAMGIIGVAKLSINRKRPNGKDYGVPSAHAGAAFSTATVLTEFYGWPVGIPSYAVASFIAFCRIDGHNHYLTDVLIGGVIGTVLGVGTSEFHKHEYAGFLVTPEISKNEYGLSIRKVF